MIHYRIFYWYWFLSMGLDIFRRGMSKPERLWPIGRIWIEGVEGWEGVGYLWDFGGWGCY